MALPNCTCGCPEAGHHRGLPRGCSPHGFHTYEADSCSSRYQLTNWYIDDKPKVIQCISTQPVHKWHRCDGYRWLTKDAYKEEKILDVIYTPVSINGESGYFLSDEEYQKLYRAATREDEKQYVNDLQIEVNNLRSAIDTAYAVASKLRYDLGNA